MSDAEPLDGAVTGASPDARLTPDDVTQDYAVAVSPTQAESDQEWTGADVPPKPAPSWRQELPRWLATLDAPSTRYEYEKAVRYFFETPGVPEVLGDLTYDLLLAYRGALARRAERRSASVPNGSRAASGSLASVGDASRLPPGAGDNSDQPDGESGGETDDLRTASHAGPLAPATANLRITALRRFLAHCATWDLIPQLTTDRIAAALRRLRIERRRPYQVLSEPEWEAFLAAARRPGATVRPPAGALDPIEHIEHGASTVGSMDSHLPHTEHERRSPWGTPRAVRLRRPGSAEDPRLPPSTTTPAPVRSRAGLTGERTALRDHALLALALATGLRAIELCALDVGDLHREWHGGLEEWWLVLPDAKTKGQRGGRTLPLGPELVRTLHDYLAASGRQWGRASDGATPLFLSGRRHLAPRGSAQPTAASARLSTQQVRRIVDRVEAQWAAAQDGGPGAAGGPGCVPGRAISPHALRHSTAVALLEGNELSGRPPASVEHVRGWLGHFDIRTTQGYLAHVDSRRHRRPFALDPGGTPGAGAVQPSERTSDDE